MLEGSCHCGEVTFSVDAQPPTWAASCNCSHCRRKGFLLSFFPREQFTLKSGKDVLQSYFFNTHKIEHQFCKICGCEAFAYGEAPDGKTTQAINLRCVPDIDIEALEIKPFDGASY